MIRPITSQGSPSATPFVNYSPVTGRSVLQTTLYSARAYFSHQIHNSPDISVEIKQELCSIEKASLSVLAVDLASPEERERLPAVVKALSTRVDDIDHQGWSFLS
jgi:hypothetical protein